MACGFCGATPWLGLVGQHSTHVNTHTARLVGIDKQPRYVLVVIFGISEPFASEALTLRSDKTMIFVWPFPIHNGHHRQLLLC